MRHDAKNRWDFKRAELFPSRHRRDDEPAPKEPSTIAFLLKLGLSHAVFGAIFATMVVPVGLALRRPLRAKLGLDSTAPLTSAWWARKP